MGENCTPALRPLGNSSQPNSNQHSFVIPHVVACPHVLPRSATIRFDISHVTACPRLATLRNGPFDTSHVTACPYVLPRHATIEFTQFQSSVRSKTPPRVRHGLRHSHCSAGTFQLTRTINSNVDVLSRDSMHHNNST